MRSKSRRQKAPARERVEAKSVSTVRRTGGPQNIPLQVCCAGIGTARSKFQLYPAGHTRSLLVTELQLTD
jgi:hypothetical protein